LDEPEFANYNQTPRPIQTQTPRFQPEERQLPPKKPKYIPGGDSQKNNKNKKPDKKKDSKNKDNGKNQKQTQVQNQSSFKISQNQVHPPPRKQKYVPGVSQQAAPSNKPQKIDSKNTKPNDQTRNIQPLKNQMLQSNVPPKNNKYNPGNANYLKKKEVPKKSNCTIL
jgi:hypothetical protein